MNQLTLGTLPRDILSLIQCRLETEDVLQLIGTGNAAISNSLKSTISKLFVSSSFHTRARLSLLFCSNLRSLLIDLTEVSNAKRPKIMHFVTHDFAYDRPISRLSTNLVSLYLKFRHAVWMFHDATHTGEWSCPNLSTLNLIEVPVESNAQQVLPICTVVWPPSITKLCIKCVSSIVKLQDLPPFLSVLDVAGNVDFLPNQFSQLLQLTQFILNDISSDCRALCSTTVSEFSLSKTNMTFEVLSTGLPNLVILSTAYNFSYPDLVLFPNLEVLTCYQIEDVKKQIDGGGMINHSKLQKLKAFSIAGEPMPCRNIEFIRCLPSSLKELHISLSPQCIDYLPEQLKGHLTIKNYPVDIGPYKMPMIESLHLNYLTSKRMLMFIPSSLTSLYIKTVKSKLLPLLPKSITKLEVHEIEDKEFDPQLRKSIHTLVLHGVHYQCPFGTGLQSIDLQLHGTSFVHADEVFLKSLPFSLTCLKIRTKKCDMINEFIEWPASLLKLHIIARTETLVWKEPSNVPDVLLSPKSIVPNLPPTITELMFYQDGNIVTCNRELLLKYLPNLRRNL